MDVLGLIFSNIHNKENFEVTSVRTIASCPIGGRYRLIDFALSNMVNAGISHVGVVTKNNYQSLMDHVGSGKEWDLARKKGGLVILPPLTDGGTVYNTRLEAIKNQFSFINDSKEEYVILTDCYSVNNINLKAALDFHIEKNADITCIYHEHEVNINEFVPAKVFTLDEDSRVIKMEMKPNIKGRKKASLDIWIMKRELLVNIVKEANTTNYSSFNRDILQRNLRNLKIYGFEHTGYYGNISNLNSYFHVNMDLLSRDVRRELFYVEGRSIYTKVRDSAPTKYTNNACIKNSIIADGCIIEGTVENSVIFRGARISKGCSVTNSILMQDTIVNEGIKLDYVITDKNVTIANKKELIGDKDNLIYVNKGGKL